MFARLAATSLAAVLALPLAAMDLKELSDEERAQFRAEVRAYLLENPEVIMEAIEVLQNREAQAQAQADVDMVSDNAEAIFNDGFSWVGGNPDGDITLVEFLDYRCGYCRKAFDEAMAAAKSTPAEPVQVWQARCATRSPGVRRNRAANAHAIPGNARPGLP